MKIKIKLYDISFMTLSIANVFLINKFEFLFLTYVLIGMLVLFKMVNILDNENFLLYSLFIPNKYVQLLSVLLFLIFSNKIITKKIRIRESIFILYIIFVGIINCIVYNGFYFCVFFQVVFYYCVLQLMDYFNRHFSLDAILITFNKMFYLQIISILIEYLILHETMDALTGTLISAHYLGVFLLIYAYILCKNRSFYKKKYIFYIKMIILLIALYFIDAKHIVLAFFCALLLAKVFSLLKIKCKFTLLMMIVTGLIVLFLWGVNSSVANEFIVRNQFLSTYILNDNYNKKFQFYINTFHELKGFHGLFGYGVGEYGSQICITFSKGIIYDWNNTLSAYCYGIVPFFKAIKGLMTEWYSNIGIVISSMVLGYPFVSYIALVSELGIIGLFLFMRIFDKKYEYSNGVFIIMFLLLTHFDTYFEIPCVFVLILIAEKINNKKI